MDFKGQYYNERTFQVLIILFGLIGFFAGYVQQDFRLTFHFLAAGSSLAACICLPDWPCWNRHPVAWLEVEADETGRMIGEPYDARCDVWSVGVTAHVLLSAALPFDVPEDADEASLVAAAMNIRLFTLGRLGVCPESSGGFIVKRFSRSAGQTNS